MSNFLYDNVFEGDTLEVTHPFGDVVLSDGHEPLLLVSAGIGCTPIIGMLNHLAETSSARSVAVLHADRSAAGHAHRAELIELVERLPHARVHRWYEDLGDRQPAGASGSAASISRPCRSSPARAPTCVAPYRS